MYLWYMHKPYLLRYNKKYNETIIYDSVVGGPNIIKTGKLLNVHNNKMYWCISDNILLNLNKKEIEEYKMDELNRYRQSMPLNSNPFIMELEIKE